MWTRNAAASLEWNEKSRFIIVILLDCHSQHCRYNSSLNILASIKRNAKTFAICWCRYGSGCQHKVGICLISIKSNGYSLLVAQTVIGSAINKYFNCDLYVKLKFFKAAIASPSPLSMNKATDMQRVKYRILRAIRILLLISSTHYK